MMHAGLVKNTVLLFVNKISLVLSSFVLLPVFTANFSAAEYGLATLIFGYVSLLAPLLILRLDIGIFRHLVEARNDREKTKTVISSFVFTLIPISLTFLCLVAIAGLIFNIPFYALVVGNIGASILFAIMSQFTRGIGRTNTFVLVSLVVAILSFVISLCGITLFGVGIEIIFIAALTSQLVGTILLAITTKVRTYISRQQVDKSIQRQLIGYSLPLVPDSISFWVMNISDRTILSVFLGVASAGVYTVANKFSTIIDQAIGVFFQAWTESATEYAQKENRDRLYSDVFSAYMRIFVTLPLLITAILPFVFPLFVKGQDFQSAYIYIPILMYAMIAHAAEAFISSIYLANDLTKQIAKTTIFGAVANIVINVTLVAFIGIWAAVASTLIAYLTTAVYRYQNIQKYGIKLSIDAKLMGVFALMIILNASLYYWNNSIGNIASLVGAIVFAVILNQKIASAGWSIVKQRIAAR